MTWVLACTGLGGEELRLDYVFASPEAAALFATEVLASHPERCVLRGPGEQTVPGTQVDFGRPFQVQAQS